MKLVHVALPLVRHPHELSVDRRGLGGQRPIPAQSPELKDPPPLRTDVLEAPPQSPEPGGVHVVGAVRVADGESPAPAEREAGRREGGLSGHRDTGTPC